MLDALRAAASAAPVDHEVRPSVKFRYEDLAWLIVNAVPLPIPRFGFSYDAVFTSIRTLMKKFPDSTPESVTAALLPVLPIGFSPAELLRESTTAFRRRAGGLRAAARRKARSSP